MLSHYKYTDKEKEELMKSLTIIVDSREKVNGQILEWFDKNHVKYVVKALKNGDYSFYVPANEKLNIDRDLYFDRQIMIERKASLEEISGNITQNRARFEEELATFSGKKYLMRMLITPISFKRITRPTYHPKRSSPRYIHIIIDMGLN